MTKPKGPPRTRGIDAFGTPARGEIVSMSGVEGIVVRRSEDGSTVWARFGGAGRERMFTHRGALIPYVGVTGVPSAFREFPEKIDQPALTIGRGGW